MKLGIGITTFPWRAEEIGPAVTRIAAAADEAGVDSLRVMDHFFQIRLSGLPPESPMPEAYATLAFLGGLTKKVKLGTLVTSVAYRHPGLLVKAVTSLDVLTGGRVISGVGAGAPWGNCCRSRTRCGAATRARTGAGTTRWSGRAGRDFAAIEKTVTSNVDFGDDPKAGAVALLAHLREMAATGIDHALVSPQQAWDTETFDAIAAILPEVHAIEPNRG